MRSVLVTGGSRGIGLGISVALAQSGFQVIALARSKTEEFAAAHDEVAAQGQGALHFRAFDLSDIEAIPGLVKTLRAEFGTFFGLVNNAGLSVSGILPNMADHDIARILRLNLHSPIVLTKHMLRSMLNAREGRIVNITSIVATQGYGGLSVYSATKAALGGFTNALARDVGPLGITVNSVAPGFVDTALTQELTQTHRDQIARRSALRRLPDIADVASAVSFLFSGQARNITGTTLTVDAGNTA